MDSRSTTNGVLFYSMDPGVVGSGYLSPSPVPFGPLCIALCLRLNCSMFGRLSQGGGEECWLSGEAMGEPKPQMVSLEPFEQLFYREDQLTINGSDDSGLHDIQYPGSYLYDGEKLGDHIFHSDQRFEPWVRLLLVHTSLVRRLTVWNRNDHDVNVLTPSKIRSRGLEFRVAVSVGQLPESKAVCSFYEPVIAFKQQIICTNPIVGAIVQIQIKNRIDFLHLHEVEVYGIALLPKNN